MKFLRSKLEAGSSTGEAEKAVQGGGSLTGIPGSPQSTGLLVPNKNLRRRRMRMRKRKRKRKVLKVW